MGTNHSGGGWRMAGGGQAAAMRCPMRAISNCGSVSITQRWSWFSFVNTHATTRDCRYQSVHSVRAASTAPAS